MLHHFNNQQLNPEHGIWQFQEAKSKLSEVLNRVEELGEQVIVRNKNKYYVILSEEKYQSYFSSRGSIMDIFLQFPHPDVELEIDRSNELIPGFQGRIVDFDLKLALRWGSMVGTHKREGINIPVMDSLIAATALHHELIVVTENSIDFNLANVFTINPWKT